MRVRAVALGDNETMSVTEKRRGAWSPEMRRPSLFWLLAGLILPLWSLMVRYRYTKETTLPQQGPFILAPNHFSEIDPIAMGAAVWHLGRLPRFMAKASLFKVPVFGSLLRGTGQIPVERAGAASRANPIGAASQLIEKGQGVIVYPEGTLTRDPDLWPMRGKTGAVRLALESGIPLYPAAHWGTQDLMPRYGKKIHPFPRKTIHVSIGEPLDLSEFGGKTDQKTVTAATEKLMTAISALLGELRGETPPKTRWNPADHQQTETGRF